MVDDLLSLLNGGTASRTVWTADLDYWIAGQEQRGTADPAWRTEEGFLELCGRLRVMPYYYYRTFWLARPCYDASVSVRTERRGRTATTVWRTSSGELREEMTYSPLSCSTATTRHAVQSEDDLRVLLDLMEHRSLEPANLDGYPERLARWREKGGLPAIALPRSPLPAFLYEWAGLSQGICLIADHPELVGELLALMRQQEEPVLEAVARAAPPLVHFADNLSGDTLGGYYEEYLRPVHEHRLSVLHAAGTRCAVHLDGTAKGLLSQVVDAGFDAVEALTPMPGGDLPVESMREEAGSDAVVLWGGVPGILFAPPFTWGQVAAHVRRVLAAWRGTPFALGVADQVPPDGDIGYCARIADLIREEGG